MNLVHEKLGTPIQVASAKKELGGVKLLVSAGARINDREGRHFGTAMYEVQVGFPSRDLVDFLHEHGGIALPPSEEREHHGEDTDYDGSDYEFEDGNDRAYDNSDNDAFGDEDKTDYGNDVWQDHTDGGKANEIV